ncbi:MAG: PAS domain S-box protein [Magnetococcales bacterium]|nr:PAS domain S-box protein [Magnetococcales bacterium]
MAKSNTTEPLILVVDDDEDFRDSLAGFLETNNYRVHEVDNGSAALEYCTSNTPDLILLDANMPQMDGFKVCSELNKNRKNIATPIIMITALADEASVDQAFTAGAEEYITKPVNWSVLRLRIHRIIERRKLEAQQLIYTSAFEQSASSIVITNLDGNIEHVNPAFLHITGYTTEEVIGKNPRILKSNKTPPEVYTAMWQALCEGESWQGEFYNLTKSGKHILESATIVPIRNQFGTITNYLASKSDITSQREAETKLQESQRELAKAQEVSNTGSWTWNMETDRIRWSQEMFRICGVDPETFTPTYEKLLEMVHPDDQKLFKETVSHTIVNIQEEFQDEYRISRPDGEERWVDSRGETILAPNGEIEKLVGTMRDITDRKKREQALHENREQYRLLLETTKFIPWELDVDNKKFTYIGPQIEDFLGFSVEDWSDMDYWSNRIHEDDRKDAVNFCVDTISKGEDNEFEYRMVSKDEKIVWFRHVVTIVRKGEAVTGLRGFFIDITAQKQAENELRHTMELLKKNENQLQAILSNTSAMVFLKDLNGRYLLVNRRFEQLFNVNHAGITGKTDFDIFPAETAKRMQDNDRQAMEAGKSLEIEELIYHDNKQHTYLSVKFPLYDDAKNIFAIGGIATDITDRKKAEDDLSEAKKSAELANRAKSQFLAAMSHDIRTPMNAILGMGEVLAESGLNQAQLKYLDVLTHAGEGLLALINDILDLSKIEAGQLQMDTVSFNLQDLITGTHQILNPKALQKNIVFSCKVSELCHTTVVGDPQRIRQVLLNLLGNSIKFTKNGVITLTVEPCTADSIKFVVTDSGIGIPKHKLEKIFQPFTQADESITRRFGGTGLGLSICNHLVEKMGGEIGAESKLGKGSRFSFTARLPKSSGSIADAKLTRVVRDKHRQDLPSKHQTDNTSINILLVDDAADNLLVVSAFLKKSQHKIQTARDGQEAVEAYTNGNFDLILMDIMMPIMDGYEATRKIRALEKNSGQQPVPIVALTANAMKDDLEKTIDAGCNLYLSKPVRMAHLLDVVNKFAKKTTTQTPSDIVDSTREESLTPKNSKSAINLKILNRLRHDLGGDIDIPLKKFLEMLPERLQTIITTFEQKNPKEMSHATHKLKGSAASFGAVHLQDICHRIESIGRDGLLPEDGSILSELTEECSRVKAELELQLNGDI